MFVTAIVVVISWPNVAVVVFQPMLPALRVVSAAGITSVFGGRESAMGRIPVGTVLTRKTVSGGKFLQLKFFFLSELLSNI